MTTISHNLFLEPSHKKYLQRENLSPIFFHYTSLRKKCPYSEFFWSVFSSIRTEYWERYGLSLRIQSEYGKIMTKKTPNMDTFHAVLHYIKHVRIQTFTGKYGSEKTRFLLYFTQCYVVPKKLLSMSLKSFHPGF